MVSKNNKYKDIYLSTKSLENKRDRNTNYISYRFFYRPFALIISPVFIKLGIAANHVSIFRVSLFIITFLSSMIIDLKYFPYLFLITFFCVILDFVDGIIARYTNTQSLFGKVVDQTSDFLFPTIYFLIPIFNNYKETNLFAFETEMVIIYFVVVSYYLTPYFQVRITRFRETKLPNSEKQVQFKHKSKVHFLKDIFSLLNQINYLIIFIMFLVNIIEYSILYLLLLRTISMFSLAKKIANSRAIFK